jgi:ketosteroid isomerase-like protein
LNEVITMNIQDVVNRYFDSIRSRNIDNLSALYADDVTFTLPNGEEFSGKAAICEMHQGVFTAGAPVPTPQSMVLSDKSAAVEIEARLPDGTTRRTANFYYLNDAGKIQRLSVYMRGG